METKQLKDGLQRRRRNAPRQPVRSITLNERDINILTFIHLYGGMLTTDIIFKYATINGLYKSKQALSLRLKEMYHDGGYLDRPTQQRQIEYPERYNLVHRVSEKAELELKARRLFSDKAPRPYGAYQHQMMTACLYASYYLSALEHGFGFMPQHKLPHPTIVIDGKNVTPDALFMLTVEGKNILIFLEADRATEAGHSDDDKRKSWGRSVEQYKKIIGDKLYKDHYQVPPNCGAQVHVVTINFTMQQKILRQIQRVFPQGCTYILTHTSIAFGDNSHPAPYIDMMKTIWDRWGHNEFTYLK